jgi:D-3-phosphoglycerate dehydrogenase
MYRAVFLDHVFDDIGIIRSILSGVAEVFENQCTTEDEAIRVTHDADAVMVVNYSPVSRRIIERLDRCRIISRFGIGIDAVDVSAATEKGILVTNVPDYCLDEVSDHAIAMMLHLERKLSLADASVRASLKYRPQDLKPIKGLNGSTAGIIGLGRIGRLTAKKLSAFGMRILFFDPFLQNDWREDSWTAQKVDFDTLMRESDHIIIHAPATPQSYHCINERSLALAQRAPIIVNVGRGELIDTNALVSALKSGRISAAGLDVLEEADCLDSSSEIVKLDCVLLSPHSAWYSEKALVKLQTIAATSVREALSGKMPSNCVNPNVSRQA